LFWQPRLLACGAEAYRADGGSFISVQLFTFRAEAFGTLLAGSAIKRK
jgi:hypothetical protein